MCSALSGPLRLPREGARGRCRTRPDGSRPVETWSQTRCGGRPNVRSLCRARRGPHGIPRPARHTRTRPRACATPGRCSVACSGTLPRTGGRRLRPFRRATARTQSSGTEVGPDPVRGGPPVTDRPSPTAHLESLRVTGRLLETETLTLVDDVVTRGSTFLGCAMALRGAYPAVDVRAFAFLRQRWRVDDRHAPHEGEISVSGENEVQAR